MVDGYYVEFYNDQINASTHSFTLNKLRHFSMYKISVQVCRYYSNDSEYDDRTVCSDAVVLHQRTGKLGLSGIQHFMFRWL